MRHLAFTVKSVSFKSFDLSEIRQIADSFEHDRRLILLVRLRTYDHPQPLRSVARSLYDLTAIPKCFDRNLYWSQVWCDCGNRKHEKPLYFVRCHALSTPHLDKLFSINLPTAGQKVYIHRLSCKLTYDLQPIVKNTPERAIVKH